MAGMPEACAVQHALGDRVGDDSRRPSGDHVADGMADRADRSVGAAWVGAAGLRGGPAQEIAIARQIKCRNFQFASLEPRRNRDIRPDAGRLAQCQRQGFYHARQRYSIIAALRTSSRYALDFFSNFSANIFSRTSRFFGVSTVVGLRPHSATISTPCLVTSGAVRWPTGVLSSSSR